MMQFLFVDDASLVSIPRDFPSASCSSINSRFQVQFSCRVLLLSTSTSSYTSSHDIITIPSVTITSSSDIKDNVVVSFHIKLAIKRLLFDFSSFVANKCLIFKWLDLLPFFSFLCTTSFLFSGFRCRYIILVPPSGYLWLDSFCCCCPFLEWKSHDDNGSSRFTCPSCCPTFSYVFELLMLLLLHNKLCVHFFVANSLVLLHSHEKSPGDDIFSCHVLGH